MLSYCTCLLVPPSHTHTGKGKGEEGSSTLTEGGGGGRKGEVVTQTPSNTLLCKICDLLWLVQCLHHAESIYLSSLRRWSTISSPVSPASPLSPTSSAALVYCVYTVYQIECTTQNLEESSLSVCFMVNLSLSVCFMVNLSVSLNTSVCLNYEESAFCMYTESVNNSTAVGTLHTLSVSCRNGMMLHGASLSSELK